MTNLEKAKALVQAHYELDQAKERMKSFKTTNQDVFETSVRIDHYPNKIYVKVARRAVQSTLRAELAAAKEAVRIAEEATKIAEVAEA